MKNAHPHTGKWLREWFPEQTKSIPSILVWTVVYILDAVLVFWAAAALGIDILALPYRLTSLMAGAYLLIALALFWVEASVYNRILANYRKTLE